MGMAVAPEKFLEPEHVAATRVTDDDRPGEASFEKSDASQDERAHDALAELGFGHQDVAQAARSDHENLDRFHRHRVDQRGTAGELRKLTHEPARSMRDDRLAPPENVVLRDRELSAQYHEHARAGLAGGYQLLACGMAPHLAEAPQPVDLGGRPSREPLRIAGFDARSLRSGHDSLPRFAASRRAASASRSSLLDHCRTTGVRLVAQRFAGA